VHAEISTEDHSNLDELLFVDREQGWFLDVFDDRLGLHWVGITPSSVPFRSSIRALSLRSSKPGFTIEIGGFGLS
jgi:hypothetical protein